MSSATDISEEDRTLALRLHLDGRNITDAAELKRACIADIALSADPEYAAAKAAHDNATYGPGEIDDLSSRVLDGESVTTAEIAQAEVARDRRIARSRSEVVAHARVANRPPPPAALVLVAARTARPRGAGRPRARAMARASSRGGDSGDDGSNEGDGEPAAARHLLYLVHPRYGRVSAVLARFLRGLGE